MDTTQPIRIDLTELIPYYPWAEMFVDLGYHMPYPEVLMTSDRAYALSTQINGLLMMQSWEVGNDATYSLERIEASIHEAYHLTAEVRLETLDEAWAHIGIAEDRLLHYLRSSLISWVMATQLAGRPMRSLQLPSGVWMLIAE